MMLISLCYLLCHAHAEWVEIAQNSYRRNTLRKEVEAVITTDAFSKYPNLTVQAPGRYKGLVNKVNHLGNVRRVPAATATTRKYPDERTSHTGVYTETSTERASNKQEYYDIDLGHSLKITKFDYTKLNGRDKPADNLDGLSSIDVIDEYIYTDRTERIYSTTEPIFIKNHPEIGQSHRPNFYSTSDSGVHFNHLNTEPSTSSIMDLNINESNNDNDYKFHPANLKTNEPPQINRPSVSKNPKLPSSVESHPNRNEPSNQSVNTRTAELNTSKDVDGEKTTKTPKEFSPSLESQTPEVSRFKLETSEKEYFGGMWRVLTFIKDLITKNTQRNVKSKIKYLEDLKNNILYSIEDHINRAWPDDEAAHSRAARSAHARGHVELPSSEGALMTISFLTFAVFLIKLVLQVIHAYKNKSMMMTPAVVTAIGRAAAGTRARN